MRHGCDTGAELIVSSQLRGIGDGESACKRDFVRRLAAPVWPSLCATYPRGAVSPRRTGRPSPLLGLAPGGVCRAVRVAPHAGALLPHRFTLTCDRSPGPSAVSLCCTSVRSPRPGSRQHPARWSPDFPRRGGTAPRRGPPADSPSPRRLSLARGEFGRIGIVRHEVFVGRTRDGTLPPAP